MRRFIIVALCLLGIAAAADWYWLNPLPTANDLTSVWFNGDTGYISGASTFRTTDAGATWAVVAPYGFEEVRFPAGATIGYGTAFGIRKTTDAGETWTYTQIGDYEYTHQVCFPAGDDTGYATFGMDPPSIAKTCDGFATHTERRFDNLARAFGMAFTDTRRGWIVGGGGGGGAGFIIRTTDGGATWTRQDSGHVMGRRRSISALADGQTVFVCGYEPSMQKTTDAGAHWDTLPFPAVDEALATCFPGGPDTGFVIAELYGGNHVYRTTDSGQTWDTMPGSQYADAMYFPDGVQTGYAVGPGGTFVHTTDAGASWASVTRWTPGTAQNMALMDLDFPAGEATGFAVGGKGAFLRTDDGGRHWTRPCIFDSIICQWDGVDFLPDKLTGFVCGTAGSNNNAVLRTRDGGVTWDTVLVRTGGTGVFTDVLFPFGDDTGYVADRTGRAVWKTTDCGDSWVRHATPGLGYMNSIDFPTRGVGYAVGTSGAIVKTTDGGETWSDKSTADQLDLYDVEFPVGPDTGWVCGEGGRIDRTTDGGATWEFQNTPSAWFWSICFPAGTQVGFCGGEGIMLTTIDGGVTWIANVSLTTQDLWAMQFPLNAGTGYIVGGGGTILKTGFGGGVEEERSTPCALRSTPYAGATLVRGVLEINSQLTADGSQPRIGLLDISGRKVQDLRPGPNDVSRLAPGVYFLAEPAAGSRRQAGAGKVVVMR